MNTTDSELTRRLLHDATPTTAAAARKRTNPPRRLPPTIKPLKFIEYKSFRQRKLCHGQNLIRDSNTDFRINPDPDVYRIVPKWTSKCSRFILFSAWIISPSIVKKPVNDCMRNANNILCYHMFGEIKFYINILKSSVRQWWKKWKSGPESASVTGSPPEVNYFYRVTSCARLPWPCLVDVRYRDRDVSCSQNHRQNDGQTKRPITLLRQP